MDENGCLGCVVFLGIVACMCYAAAYIIEWLLPTVDTVLSQVHTEHGTTGVVIVVALVIIAILLVLD